MVAEDKGPGDEVAEISVPVWGIVIDWDCGIVDKGVDVFSMPEDEIVAGSEVTFVNIMVPCVDAEDGRLSETDEGMIELRVTVDEMVLVPDCAPVVTDDEVLPILDNKIVADREVLLAEDGETDVEYVIPPDVPVDDRDREVPVVTDGQIPVDNVL